MHKLSRLATLLAAAALSGCASNTTGENLKNSFDTGVAAYDAGDYAKAYKIWSSIDDEDIAAMRNVAMMRRQGLGTDKDPKGAELMYERAAEAGLPTAQADLADMLIRGEAGPPDPQRALPLLEAAAAANHPLAQYELAQFYEVGQLVPRNMTVARHLYAAAASHGMKEAQQRLDQLGPAPPVQAPAAQPAPTTAAAPSGAAALSAAVH
ncbi:MAG TPA: tetratricopeptide repeat protein [Rhizomicrobium sp.]|jgi:TPR repeat protein|nr:tetratricopeptide repeat protein [Rhizomicrobium sp.]